MTVNFGVDLSSLDDLDETREVSGLELVAQDAYWRLQTSAGAGILAEDAPDYGFDLLEALGTVDSEASLPDRIKAELLKDERIDDVVATVIRSVDGPAAAWDITIRCVTGLGTFELVGFADDSELNLAVKLLPGVV